MQEIAISVCSLVQSWVQREERWPVRGIWGIYEYSTGSALTRREMLQEQKRFQETF